MWGWWSWWRHRKSSRSQVRKLRKLRVSYGAFRVYQIFVFNLVGHNFTYSIWFTEGGSNALSAQRCTHIRTRLVKDEEIKRRLTYTHSEKRGNGRNMSPAICLLCTYFSERRWHFTMSAIIHTLTKKKKREDERKIKWQRLEDDLCAPCQRFSTSVPTFRFLFVFFSPIRCEKRKLKHDQYICKKRNANAIWRVVRNIFLPLQPGPACDRTLGYGTLSASCFRNKSAPAFSFLNIHVLPEAVSLYPYSAAPAAEKKSVTQKSNYQYYSLELEPGTVGFSTIFYRVFSTSFCTAFF